MSGRFSHHLALLLVLALAGCDSTNDPTPVAGSSPGGITNAESSRSANAEPGPSVQAESNQFMGRVTNVDGSPISLPGVEFEININGVTGVGQNNNFRPPIGPDGTFKLGLPQGLFYPPYGTITFPFEGKKYIAELDPVNPYKGTRDGAPGIVQNFVWRITGPKPAALDPDINNATHWYGITMPAIAAIYRDDTQQVVKPLPDGTKIVWTFTPTSKLIDGSEGKPVTVERKWSAMSSLDSINDLPPANYEFSAIAILPDGMSKPVLVQEWDERKYKAMAKLTLQPYANGNTVVVVPAQISFVVE